MRQRQWTKWAGPAALGVAVLAAPVWTSGADAVRVVVVDPRLAESLAILERAELTYEPTRLQEVIAVLDQLAQKEPGNARYHYYLGRAYFPLINIHDYDGDAKTAEELGEKGLEYVRTAVRLDEKGNPDAYRLLGDYYGRLSGYQGVFGRMRYGGRSLKFHKKAREMDPQNVLAVIGDGADKLFAPSAFGGDPNAAVGLFTKAVQMEPASALGHVWLGRSYLKLKKPALAREHFEKALALEPRSGFARGEYERAKDELPQG
jgi:tetratricopeptide (TPR) repeat protein